MMKTTYDQWIGWFLDNVVIRSKRGADHTTELSSRIPWDWAVMLFH